VIEPSVENLSGLAKLTASLKENIYHLAIFGMTQQTMIDIKAIATMIVVGALSAFGGAFLTARDNAMELKQYSKAQEEFRTEMRLADRLTRQEILNSTFHAGQMSMTPGMSGMNGKGK
jgi:hypothetical protein